MAMAYLGLGSNLGDRKYFLTNAVTELESRDGIVVRTKSPIIETDPWGMDEQGKFLNCVICVETSLSPTELLSVCQEIENDHGRERTVRWGPRTLDLDLLLYGDMVCHDNDLTLPHPEMHKRRFVLQPICEIAPDLIHPVLNQCMRDLLKALPEETACECHTCGESTEKDCTCRSH